MRNDSMLASGNSPNTTVIPKPSSHTAQEPLLDEVIKIHLKFNFGKMSVRAPWKPWIRSVLPLLGVQIMKTQGKKPQYSPEM